jgi:peptidoglycan/LPS O-acetylase OafA/YrhL
VKKVAIRVRSLDALRGLAALAVVIHHWTMTFLKPARPIAGDAALAAGLIHQFQAVLPKLLELGTAAVMIFFVLSGFVLALSLEADGDSYAQFVIKRVCRILPPMACAVLLSAALYLTINPHPLAGVNLFLNGAGWTVRPDVNVVFGHWALINDPRFVSLDSVIWTLRHEMRISLVFPLIAYCVRLKPGMSLIGSFVVSAVAAWATRYVSAGASDWLTSIHFSFLFFWGAGIAQHRLLVKRWVMRCPLAGRLLLLGLCLALLVFASSSLKGNYCIYMGAIGLVALCSADSVLVNALERKPLLYLGKVSYSLYLVHMPVLLAVMHLFYGSWPNWLLICTGVALAMAISEVFNRLVEKPSQRLGRVAAAAAQRRPYKPKRV